MDTFEIEDVLNDPKYVNKLGGTLTTENLDALWLLKNTNKRKDYNRLLSLIILNALSFNKKELEWLANFVKKPLVGKIGRPTLDELKLKIARDYMIFNDGIPTVSRKDALKSICKKFQMTIDTARKHYDKVAKDYKSRRGI